MSFNLRRYRSRVMILFLYLFELHGQYLWRVALYLQALDL